MSAAGAVIVVCTVLGGAPAFAQSPDASAVPASPGPAQVTGQEVCGGGTVCDEQLSDPRVTGKGIVDMDVQCPAGDTGCVAQGTFTLEGPDGDWVGPFVGTFEATTAKAAFLVTTEGTDAYEGWSFVAVFLDPLNGEPASVSGVIYEGSAPRMEWPTPAASPSPQDG
jgi:hypothetical protein